ncbi:MAG: ABC transporter ATP-binding protein [Azospirillaceae bacterium]
MTDAASTDNPGTRSGQAGRAGPPRLALAGITKRFPGTLANDSVDLDLAAGEIHALLGENGAGKSTLVKIVYGILEADAGSLRWEGAPVTVASPADARRLGIGMVFQHFSLFEAFTVAENIALGLESGESVAAITPRILEVSERYGLALHPDRPVHTLSVGERQRVEIVRCLLQDPKLLIMDEPTSVLTPQEATRLFETLRRLAEEGRTILYISHKLEEIRALCSRATVMRGGRVVAVCDPRRETAHGLAEMMIGRELRIPEHKAPPETGAARLEVRGLSVEPDHALGTPVRDASLAVHAGEIVGIAGVAGNGQAELLAALSGEARAPDAGMILIDGTPVGRSGPERRRALGLCYVPEERLGHGAVPTMTLAENAILGAARREGLARHGFLRLDRARDFAGAVIDRFRVVARGPDAQARSLSGGNLQRFIVGREVAQRPSLLLCAAPTWGVDAGAAAAIHRALIELANDGVAILVVSQDLDELFALADRIAVLFDGRLSEACPLAETDLERIGLLMGGADPDAAREALHVGEAPAGARP